MQKAKKIPRLTLIDAQICLKKLRKTQKVEICQFANFMTFLSKSGQVKAVKLSSFGKKSCDYWSVQF